MTLAAVACQQYARRPLGHQLDGNTLGLWRMDDSALPFTDISGHGYNIGDILANNVTPAQIVGLINDGGSARGSCRSINIYKAGGDTIPAIIGEISAECWVQLDADFASGFAKQMFVAHSGAVAGSGVNMAFQFGVTNGGALYIGWQGSILEQFVSSVQLVAGRVYHCAFVRKFINAGANQQALLYLNGQLVATSGALSNCLNNITQFWTLGGNLNGSNCLRGSIDDIRVSTVARSAAEIATSYALGTLPLPSVSCAQAASPSIVGTTET